MTDIFRECQKLVSAQDAARRYGLTFDRKGWAICPFHMDRHPSMSFKNGRFRCWTCGASGDSIDFTARLMGLKPIAAVERLNADFALSLPLHRKPTPEEAQAARRQREVAEAHQLFEKWRKTFLLKLCDAFRVAHFALLDMTDLDALTDCEVHAIQMQATVEHLIDILSDGTPEEQMRIFRERRVIQSRIDQILNHSPMKSGAA